MNPQHDTTDSHDPDMKQWMALGLQFRTLDPATRELVTAAIALIAEGRTLAPAKLERRIARFSRQCARLVIARRTTGDRDGATRIETAGIGFVDLARRGAA